MAARLLFFVVSALVAVTVRTSVVKRATWSPREVGGGARIASGYQAGVGQFPHQALILGDGSAITGGSLITRTAVLTTVHCALAYQTCTVRLGGIHRTQDEPTAWTIVSTWAVAHPNYNSTGRSTYNVGVVFLPEEAPLNPFINTVALPSSLDVNHSFAGQSGQISGWGRNTSASCCPEILQWTEVTVIPNSACTKFYESGAVIESTLCAGNENTGYCSGDVGSALVLKFEGGYKQIGVANSLMDVECAAAGVPATYTRVTSVLDWIATTADIDLQ